MKKTYIIIACVLGLLAIGVLIASSRYKTTPATQKATSKQTKSPVSNPTSMVIISKAYYLDDKPVIDADIVEMLFGDAAIATAKADTGCTDDHLLDANCASSLNSGYFIHKTGQILNAVPVAPTAEIIILTNGTEETPVSFDNFALTFSSDINEMIQGRLAPYKLTIDKGTITGVKQIYIP